MCERVTPYNPKERVVDSTGRKTPRGKAPEAVGELWDLRLYIAGQTQKSVAAFTNLKKICEEHLKGHYNIHVVDLMINPALAKVDQIIAIPTLIKKLPKPVARMMGDLSNRERVLLSLNLHQGPRENGTSV